MLYILILKQTPYVKQIHRVLIPIVPYGHVVDHKNGDTFDNRLDNLEIVTRAENTRRARTRRQLYEQAEKYM